jgi:hypothetical protein
MRNSTSFVAQPWSLLAMMPELPPRLLVVCLSTLALHTASDGLIWPMVGYASIASRNGGPSTFFPCASAFLAKQESLRPAILRCATAASGAVRSPLGL